MVLVMENEQAIQPLFLFLHAHQILSLVMHEERPAKSVIQYPLHCKGATDPWLS